MKFLILLASVLAFAAANSARGRIYRGLTAQPNGYPYQAGIQVLTEVDKSWCGGTLIGDTWVLTAAHCFDDSAAGNITVYLGSIHRQEGVYTFRINNDYLIIHEYYNTDTVENDIALIRIPRVVYSNAVKPAQLPSKNAKFAHRYAFASGWGYEREHGSGGDTPNLSTELQWARFWAISNVECAEFYPDDEISDQDLCAVGDNNASTCAGDSGGPLLTYGGGKLIGISSTVGTEGCEHGKPVIFTRVSYYREWITSKTGI